MSFDGVLKLKGWTVFALLFAGALFGFGSVVFSSFPSLDRPSSSLVFGLGMALLELLYFGWALAVGASMNSRLPEPLRRGFLLPATGLVIATGYSFWFAGQFASLSGPRSFGCIPMAVHVFVMAVNFYLLWYVSRALVAAEENGKPPLDRILGLFFVLWLTMFLPIGAWWAQRRARAVAGAPQVVARAPGRAGDLPGR